MEEAVSLNKVYHEILALKKEFQSFRNRLVDMDEVMTDEEEKRYENALIELREGKTISLEDLEEDLGR